MGSVRKREVYDNGKWHRFPKQDLAAAVEISGILNWISGSRHAMRPPLPVQEGFLVLGSGPYEQPP